MVLLKSLPSLADIEALVAKVPHFPFSIRELIELAEEEHFPEDVIDFYKTFPDDEVFEDADDLLTRTEQIEIMQHEEAKQPYDLGQVPEED